MTFDTALARVNARALSRFGSACVLAGVAVQADFVSAHQQSDLNGVAISANAIQAVLSSSDVPTAVVGLPFVHGSDTYTVLDAQPDGYGLTTLILEVA